ncbi:beta-galactosidase [bacterium]|nr:beta-galactosidase [bacterium]
MYDKWKRKMLCRWGRLFCIVFMLFVGIQTPSLSADEQSQELDELPAIPYGAVYFRKSNPTKADWERDYQQAAKDGMNTFRHWFLWGTIEVAPGKYDWDDYDRQLDLAEQNGIKTIVADILCSAPEWAFENYPNARVENADGTQENSQYVRACAVGGWPGLCLDNEEVKAQAEKFLRALVKRYRHHPALGGYDVWNELNDFGDAGGCYCDASIKKFREWLKEKYNNLETLGEAWYRYSYSSWEDVQPPRTLGPYPDSIDWIQFQVDNSVRLFKWRVGIIRELDSKHPITAHAIPLGVIDRIGPDVFPVFQVGKFVDIYGFSGGSNHEERSKLRWQHWCKLDMTRSASYGKPFWSAEMPAGASWNWPPIEINEGRVTSASDVRLYSYIHFAGGSTGIFSPRWRPLQDGPFVGHFALYEMDGSPTARAKEAGRIAKWANAEENYPLRQAKPVKGEIGILVVPESQIHNYVSEGETDFYYRSVTGAYQGFLFNNIQADFVHIDDLGPEHDLVYLPYPVMLTKETCKTLVSWVEDGGNLISEGLPAYFGDRGRAGETQPNYGLDQLFGVKQDWVQFTPDLLENLKIKLQDNSRIRGALYKQAYALTSGKTIGKYEHDRIAIVDHSFGEGQTRLIGTFPGYAYNQTQDQETKQFFADLLKWAGKTQHIRSSDSRVIARLQTNGDSTFLWIVNSERENIQTELTLAPKWGDFENYKVLVGKNASVNYEKTLRVNVPARDALLLELQ